MAFRESFTLYSDESATQPILGIKADRKLDINSVMRVSDPATGAVVGMLRKKGRRSIFRSTWELEQPGMPPVTVEESSIVIAVLRRVWGYIPYASAIPIPWVFHFNGVADNGAPVLTHSRKLGIRDRYVLEIHTPALDPRLAIALAICLDAMQHR